LSNGWSRGRGTKTITSLKPSEGSHKGLWKSPKEGGGKKKGTEFRGEECGTERAGWEGKKEPVLHWNVGETRGWEIKGN